MLKLVPCPVCGHQISPQAPACPSCGQPRGPIRRRSRKLGYLGTFLLIVLLLITHSYLWGGAGDRSSCDSNWHACRDNADLMNHYSRVDDMRSACDDRAGSIRHPESATKSFNLFRNGDDYIKTGVAELIDKNSLAQNQFGTWVDVGVVCDYDMGKNAVTSLQMAPLGSSQAKPN